MYGEKTNFKTMSIDKWEEVIGLNSGPMETEAYPGYKRGTKRMAGTEYTDKLKVLKLLFFKETFLLR
jgi:hypothetical protein